MEGSILEDAFTPVQSCNALMRVEYINFKRCRIELI